VLCLVKIMFFLIFWMKDSIPVNTGRNGF
jgi:hypothetical protein